VPEDIKARCDLLVASFGDPEPEPERSRFLSRREGGSFVNERVIDESFDEEAT
jgi:hypothetical protein